MRRDHLKTAGLAAAIVLMPGGFILGATLATRYWRKRRAARETGSAPDAFARTDYMEEDT